MLLSSGFGSINGAITGKGSGKGANTYMLNWFN